MEINVFLVSKPCANSQLILSSPITLKNTVKPASKFLDFFKLYADLKKYSKAIRFITSYLMGTPMGEGSGRDGKFDFQIIAFSLDSLWKSNILVGIVG